MDPRVKTDGFFCSGLIWNEGLGSVLPRCDTLPRSPHPIFFAKSKTTIYINIYRQQLLKQSFRHAVFTLPSTSSTLEALHRASFNIADRKKIMKRKIRRHIFPCFIFLSAFSFFFFFALLYATEPTNIITFPIFLYTGQGFAKLFLQKIMDTEFRALAPRG